MFLRSRIYLHLKILIPNRIWCFNWKQKLPLSYSSLFTLYLFFKLFRSWIFIHVRWKLSSRCRSLWTSSVRAFVRCHFPTRTTPGNHTAAHTVPPSQFISALSFSETLFLFSLFDSLCILARMMTAKFLHGEIREKGGAYGGGARMGGGLFYFYSYRWVVVHHTGPSTKW